MVEPSKDSYVPSDESKALITKHLGLQATLDPGYNKSVTLKKSEAERRRELVGEIEYDFQLALNKGSHYLGKAVVNFYLKEEPKDGELFLNFQAMALCNL